MSNNRHESVIHTGVDTASWGCANGLGDFYLDSLNAALTDRLVKVVRRLLDSSADHLEPFPVDQQLSDLGMSSLKMVNLMLSVEAEFDIMIPQADITPENFHSVASITAMVARIGPQNLDGAVG